MKHLITEIETLFKQGMTRKNYNDVELKDFVDIKELETLIDKHFLEFLLKQIIVRS